MSAPTPRQIEALRALFLGRSIRDRRDNPNAKNYSSSMGGAVHRMRETMGERGWLVEGEGYGGRTFYRDKLTSAGLEVLRGRHPDLDGIDAAIVEARNRESEARIAEAREREQAEVDRRARAERRHVERARQMREVAQSYQINLDALTDDQCAAMWKEIVAREVRL